MSDQTTGHRRQTSPLDDDDLLGEILARVPLQPSSLLRISIVCKRWQRLVSGEWFRHRLCAHHRKAPLLGYFHLSTIFNDVVFNPIMEPPDRIHPRRFLPGRALPAAGQDIELLGCRHGRVVFTNISAITVFVCDPVTGGYARLAVPPEFPKLFINGTVLCAAGEQGHVHGACHSSPFKVVMVSMFTEDRRPMACVYSSDWPDEDEDGYIPVPYGVLEFDLDRNILTITKGPPINHMVGWGQIVKTIDGHVGFATLLYQTLGSLQVWHGNVNCSDTADLHSIFGLQEIRRHGIFGYDEDDNVIFIYSYEGDSRLFMLQLDTMQFKMHYETIGRRYPTMCHPFRSFYTAGDSSSLVLTL
ncbi:hypothetical protein SETIT_8G196500v2 [Setaria italica]|uniref:F-box domain-containing protein n=1 Tax=Setaria italica TaxID=4555 RepID=A0A368S9Q7_SETIT|nr:hypothetical protein SETIT_8G196500v2 [Setaria italica]